jgi:hypothetical protein
MAQIIGLEWTCGADYECVPLSTEKSAPVIRQIGRKEIPVRPLDNPGLYLAFANLDRDAVACLTFAREFGLLRTEAHDGAAERLDLWQREIRKMKSLTSMLGAGDDTPGGVIRTANSRMVKFKATSIDVVLESRPKLDQRGRAIPDPHNPNNRPVLVLQPQNLLEGMFLQLAQRVATEGSIYICKQCAKAFEAGVGESRRSIAQFCTERCKNRYHYLRRIGK